MIHAAGLAPVARVLRLVPEQKTVAPVPDNNTPKAPACSSSFFIISKNRVFTEYRFFQSIK